MARRKNSNPFEEDAAPELDVSPLIDVGFLLLIYFLVATTLLKEEADLSLVLPGIAAIQSEPVRVDSMRIQIDGDSAVWVNDELLASDLGDRSLNQLVKRLDLYARSARLGDSDPMVILECKDDAKHQRFVDVLNACAAVGIDNISLKQ